MPDLSDLIQQGAAYGWLFLPSAILLGALHGLEPGHSKTLMAGFIVAVHGTVRQAVLLGLAATISHTAIVWAVAIGGMYLGRNFDEHTSEPYFQLVSAACIVGMALWMLMQAWRKQRGGGHAAGHGHDHAHGHSHAHEHHHDAHEAAHAEDIRKFAGQPVTTGQIIMFGLTGGLIPCPAAITVLLLCLQLKKIALGAYLVLGFSVGLAITLVMSGVIAALGARHISRHWPALGVLAKKAPYASSLLVLCIGIYVGTQAALTLAH
ncbi:MAG: nickel/cobalt efflux transporter [Alphaproteobacteria bacterium]